MSVNPRGRTMVWTEPKPRLERRVSVLYYICRNGHLEHPHFMEVSLSSSDGLYLRDVMNRLNLLRGKGMADMYSWSSKRSYKNGFVWHDLSENDFVYPAQGQEYVLKGSELNENPPEIGESPGDDSDFPVVNRRRNQSWSSIDLHEYKVYKSETPSDEYAGQAADASTQTDQKLRRKRMIKEENEISPSPSSSNPETLESLIKSHRRVLKISSESEIRNQTLAKTHQNGRIKASAVLMQLISCGLKDCSSSKNQDGFSLISHYKSRIPFVASNQVVSDSSKEMMIECLNENSNGGCSSRIQMEVKEFFSN